MEIIALVVIVIIALVVWLVVTRGLQLKQLVEDGVDVNGVVVRQFKRNPKGRASTNYYLRYHYRDSQGREHEYKSNVSYDYWAAHPEGNAIAITYSASRTHVSAPRMLPLAAEPLGYFPASLQKKKGFPMHMSVASLSRCTLRLANLAALGLSGLWAALSLLAAPIAGAQGMPGTAPGLDVPARTLPVPATVSPQMQKIIGAPINPNWKTWPQTPDAWKALVAKAAATVEKNLPALREALKVKSEPMTIDGVKAFMLTPAVIPPQNRNRLLIHFHGGCYVNGPGESGTSEAIMMAGFGGFKVLSVDYRMPPDHPFPAALDDAITVWKAAQKMAPAKNMAVIGSSAGGGLTLSMVLKAKMDKLPLPGAIAPGTPMSDLTGAGDSFQTNAMVDNVLIAYGASCDVRAAMYANGRDLKDPLLSPVYGDMAGFPPTILNTGTRDLLLSNTVRVHRNLRRAGVIADLYVHEGQAHGGWYRDHTAPEAKETFEEIARFFDRHLGK